MQQTYVDELLIRIEAFLAANNIGEQYFGKLATKDSTLVHRLRNGGWCRPEAARSVHKFMDEYAPKKRGRKPKQAEAAE